MKLLQLLIVFVVVPGNTMANNCAVKYFMAEPAQNCDDQCAEQNMICAQQGGFPEGNAKQIFEDLGFPCKSEQPYTYADNPCIAPSRGHCYGTTKIPDRIDCGPGHNRAVRRLCPCIAVHYFMADYAQSCDDYCEQHNMECVEMGGFPGGNSKQIFEDLGFPCKSEQPYTFGDNPCIAPSRGHCYGTTRIPNRIDCGPGHNRAVRRLCPCA